MIRGFTHLLALVAHGVLFGPILGISNRLGLVDLPQLRHVIRQRVVGIGRGEEGLDRQQYGADLQGRTPLVWNEGNRYMCLHLRKRTIL